MIKPRNKTKRNIARDNKELPEGLVGGKRLHPAEPPICLLDTNNSLISGIKLDLVIFSDEELRLEGWCLGSPQITLLCNGFETTANINRYARQDVLDANATTSDFEPGFELTFKNPPRGAYSLKWHLIINGVSKSIDFPLEIEFPEIAMDCSSARNTSIHSQSLAIVEKTTDNKIKYEIECAVFIAKGVVLIGWLDDQIANITKIYVSLPDGTKMNFPFKDKSRNVRLIRTERPDLKSNQYNYNHLGFVIWLPISISNLQITVSFDESFCSKQSLLISQMDSDNSIFAGLQVHSGLALRSIAELLNDTTSLAYLDDIDAELFAIHSGEQIASINQALNLNNKAVLIIGWIAADMDEIQQIEISAGEANKSIKSQLVRIVRPDLYDLFPWSKSQALGFITLLDDPALLEFTPLKLRVKTHSKGRRLIQFTPSIADWTVLLSYMNGHHELAKPIAKLISTSQAMHSLPNFDERMATLLRANFLSRFKSLPTSVDNPDTTLAAVDRVFALGNVGMLIFGWHYEPKNKPQCISIRGPEGQVYDVTENMFPLPRLDVSQNYKGRFPYITELCGFACFAPIPTQSGEIRVISFEFGEAVDVWIKLPTQTIDAQRIQLSEDILKVMPCIDRPETALAVRHIADCLNDNFLISLFEDFQADISTQQLDGKFLAIDQSFVLNNKATLIIGWLALDQDDIENVELVAGDITVGIQPKLVRFIRPDLLIEFPWSKSKALGFITLLDDPALLEFTPLKLRVKTHSKGRRLIQFTPSIADWTVLLSYMNGHHELAGPIAKLISTSQAMHSLPSFDERMKTLLRANFLSRFKSLPTAVDNPDTTLAAVDRVFALGNVGMLIFGWHYEPKNKPQCISIRGPEGQVYDVTENMFPLPRLDVSQNYKGRFPYITELCGFACFAPIPTQSGEPRVIQFSFEKTNDVWLKLPSTTEAHGLQLIKDILGVIPAPDKIRASLYALFDRVLGHAIEAISVSSRKLVDEVSERQFGIPPKAPNVSIIIPLYGRYDFMRHQLAHFVDDTDFDNADLIYIVDDPSIIIPALDMAAAYHQLFNKSFKVIWYGQNLGFAGANNIGVRFARSEILLLLNSDVIPQTNGWLTTLKTALNELPAAGAVGPLLQFADNSVQHAGMQPKRDPFFPDFLLNIHPGKGINWNKGNQPSQHPLLTAACLMLRKTDYLDVGGLDEGYVIGDFEDSDLCLKLRQRGQKLWLVPDARLWHLERQSQNLESISGYRQLLTLFNGWRYHQKIINGEIANPEQSGA
jgi:GT2 family glycosyltransferase